MNILLKCQCLCSDNSLELLPGFVYLRYQLFLSDSASMCLYIFYLISFEAATHI